MKNDRPRVDGTLRRVFLLVLLLGVSASATPFNFFDYSLRDFWPSMDIGEKSVLRIDIGEKSVVGKILPDILSPPLLCSMLVADPPSIHSLLTRFDQQEPDLTKYQI